jgi:uncharacterized membrane protein YhaH (DUF805 family)
MSSSRQGIAGRPGRASASLTSRRKPALQVSFGEAVRLGFDNFLDFEGRATQGEYWWFILFNVLMTWLASFLGGFFFGFGSEGWLLMYGSTSVVLMMPSFSLYVRRLHDTDHSGWWGLISFTIIGIIPLFIWLASEGDSVANDYGPPRTG